MKHQWLAYLVVALLSIGAGVAIAGLPNNTPVDATIVVPATTDAASTTSEAAATTDPDTTDPTDTTEPEPTTTEPTDTTEPSTVTTTTVRASSTTTSTSTTVPADDLPPRSELFTIVANGANISGIAALNVERLQALGYTDIAPRNGTTIFEFTTVYFADGFEDAALRLADDLALLPDFVAPLSDAPEVLDLPDGVQLLAYIGIDRAG